MPTEVSPTIMDTKAFVQQVLNKMENTGDFERRVWDSFWRAVLEHILEGGQGPIGTVPEIIPIVRKLLQRRQNQTLRAAKVCPAFFETNRSTSLAFSELWCTAEYPDGNKKLFHTASRGQQQHAEQQVIQRLQQHTERTTLEPRIVHLYMNVSPCSECAEALLSYKAAHPHTIITIKFTSLFAHHATNHRRGLQRMAECGIKLAVFDDRDWDDLTSVIHKVWMSFQGHGDSSSILSSTSSGDNLSTRDTPDVCDTGDSGNLPQGSTNKKSRTHEENDSETYSARKKLKV